MMQDAKFPLLMGYCQYEPQTLKFTPPLNVLPEEISASVGTIRNALACSQAELLVRGLYSAWRL
jgi:4-aminobutyrate aminotransferase-like enzyme